MFDWEDRRTEQERNRDFQRSLDRESDKQLAIGFLNEVRKRLSSEDIVCGLVGNEYICSGAELLLECDDVRYKLICRVER